MKKTQFIKFIALPLFFLISLIGCAERGPEGGGAGDTTPVTFAFRAPSGGNQLSKAFAPAPSTIKTIELQVVNGLNQQIVKTVIEVIQDQTVTTTFDVPSGEDRIFKAFAKNTANIILFEGKSEPTTLNGQSISISIPMKVVEVTVGTNALSVKVVGKVKETDPISDVRVLLNDPVTGAFIKEVTTDVNGVANFGDIGKNRATITVQGAGLTTLVNVPTGAYTMTLGPGPGSPAQATLAPSVTLPPNVPIESGFYQFGHFEGETHEAVKVVNNVLSFPEADVFALKANGTFDLFAGLQTADGRVLFCGYKDDIPAGTTSLSTPVPAIPIRNIPFTSTSTRPVRLSTVRKGRVVYTFFNP